MLGTHATTLRFVLAFNQSLFNAGDLSEFTLEQVLPPSNYFTRLSVEQFSSLKDKFFKKIKYLSVMDWIALQSRNVENIKGLSLQFISQGADDIMMSDFAGGGKITFLQQHFKDEVSSYLYKANLARETLSLRPKAKRNDEIVWDDALMVAYPSTSSSVGNVLSIDEATRKLNDALVAIEAYALGDDYTKSWASHFVNARNALEGRKVETSEYANFSDISMHLSRDAEKLLQASSKSWVFGGMGSWNDGIGGSNYQKVTDTLFDIIHDCYMSVCAHSFEKSVAR